MWEKVNNNLSKIIVILIIAIVVTMMLLIYNFFNNRYVLELLGKTDITLFLNDTYKEPGYTAITRNGNDVTSKVEVSGQVDTSKVGVYQIKYQIGLIKKYRTVKVIYNEENDITMVLEGDNPKYVLKNNAYEIEKCRAMDIHDGDISSRVVVSDNVNYGEEGEYEIVYTVINFKGVRKSIKRKVIVYDLDYVLTEGLVDNKYVVKIVFKDEYYQKMQLPDGTITALREVTYPILDNGEYSFSLYDKYDYVKVINIKARGIDKTPPTGSCVVNLYDNASQIVVNANDDQKIKGYVYFYGEKKTDLLVGANYTYYDMVNGAKVTIYDEADNNTTVMCTARDLSTRYPRSYTVESNLLKYKLYIPGTMTKRNKVPLVVFLHGSGECGDNINLVDANSFPNYINNGADYNFVMVAPQMPFGKCGTKEFPASWVKAIIDNIVAKYPIDPHRIIVTGFSLGSNNTYTMIKTYPTFFAGAIPVSGRTTYDPQLLKTNIWTFHGGDGMYNEDKALMDMVIKGNPKSKFTTVEGPHNITASVYQNKEVLNWIMNAYR